MQTGNLPKVFIIDDHQLLVRGLQAILESSGEFEFCGSSANTEDALAKISQFSPDLVLVDIMFQDRPDGFEFIKILRREFPSIIPVVITAYDSLAYIKQAFDSGAAGYVTKDEPHDMMLHAFKQALEGKKYIKPELAEKILHESTKLLDEMEKERQNLGKKLQEKDRISEFKKFALQHIKEAVYLVDKTGQICYVNDESVRALGYTEKELLKMHIEAVSPEMMPGSWPKLWDEIKKNQAMTYEKSHKCKSGHVFPVEFNTNYFEFEGQEFIMGLARDITERKQVAAELEEREKRYREIFENSLDSIFLLEVLPGGHFRNLEINPAFEKSTGIPKEALIGKTIEETSPPEVAEAVNAKYIRCVEQGKVYQETLELDLPVGRRIFHSTLIPVYDDAGKIYRITGITKDITDMKQAQEQIKLLGFSLAYIKEAVFLLNKDTEIVYFNDEACRSLGYTRDELVKLSLIDFDPDWNPEKWDINWDALMEMKTATIETFHVRKSGEKFPVEVTANFFEYEGQFYNLSLVRNISERKEFEKKIQNSEKYFRNFFDNTFDCIFVIEPGETGQFMLRDLNPAAENALGFAKNLAINQPINPEYTSDEVFENYRKCLDTGEVIHHQSETNLPNGQKIWDNVLVPLKNETGEYNRIIAFSRNITDFVQLQNKLEKIIQTSPGVTATFLLRTDGSMCYSFASDNIKDLYGFSAEQLGIDAMPVFERTHPDDNARNSALLEESKNNLTPLHVEYRYLHPTRGEIWIEGHSVPQKLPNGDILWFGVGLDITERKKIEQLLVASEREFRTLAESIPDNIIRFDKNGYGYFVNHSMTITGKNGDPQWYKKKPIEQNAIILRNPNHFQETLNSVLANGRSAEIEVDMINDPENIRIHQIRFFPEFDNAGNICGALAIGRDTTERKKIEQLLRESERNFRALAENIPDFIIQYDMDCRAVYVNPSMKTRLRTIEGSFVGGKPMDRNPPVMKNTQIYQDAVERVIASCLLEELEIEIFNNTGGTNIVQIHIAPVFDDHGQITGALTIGRDITKQKQIEQILIEREREYRSLAESSPDSIIRYDLDHRILYLNNVLVRDLKLECADEVSGRRPVEVWPDGRFSVIDKAAAEVIETGRNTSVELVWEPESGQTAIAQIWVVPERDSNGKINGVIAIGRDITEQKRIEQILIEHEREFHLLARKLVHQENITSGLPNLDALTAREKKVFYLTGQGKSYLEIARELDISENTVNSFKNKIKEKLEIRNSTELLYKAMQYVMQNPE